MQLKSLTLPLTTAALLGGCSSTYYRTMEMLGYEKRELLVDRVEDARESQEEAKEQFATTLQQFKQLTGFEGGELEDRYNRLEADNDRAAKAAAEVTDRISSIEDVANAMFSEWQAEIDQIQNPSLRQRSKDLRSRTMSQYGDLLSTMRTAEQRMAPVLTAFNDHVLFLKHNLNAAAIASLDTEVAEIEASVAGLVDELQRSIDEAGAFLDSMQSQAAG